MTKEVYTTDERTENQFKAMELKKRGYNIDRIVVPDGMDGFETIAFGYSPSTTNSVKKAKQVDAKKAKEESYEFVYWN